MLEGLDKVDWENLYHAYGVAEDIPDLLKELAFEPSFDETDVPEDTVVEELCNRIFHQGDICEATVYVIPFLIELLTYDFVQNKPNIISVLSALLYGQQEKIEHFRLEQFQSKVLGYTEEQMKAILSDEKEIYEAIDKGKPVYHNLLKDENPKVKESVTALLFLLEENRNLF